MSNKMKKTGKAEMYELVDSMRGNKDFLDAVYDLNSSRIINLADKIMDEISASDLTINDTLGVLKIVDFNMFSMMQKESDNFSENLQ